MPYYELHVAQMINIIMSKYNWATIQDYYDAGHTFRDITKKFGTANKTIARAVKSGLFVPRDKNNKSKGIDRKCVTCSSILPPTRSKYCNNDCKPQKTNYEASKDCRKQIKIKLVQAFGSKCGLCNLRDHPVVYDFHHLDSSMKEFSVAQKIRAWSKVVEEAKKCVMLCAPCHRKHHAGILSIPDTIQRFDETLIEEKLTHLQDECPMCDKLKPIVQSTCSQNCANKMRSKIDWDTLDLENLYKSHTSVSSLARSLGLSDNAVKKQLIKRGIMYPKTL